MRISTEELKNTIDPLDGPGRIKHLDSLRRLPAWKAVQWVLGAGVPDQSHWPEIYRKIHAARKGLQVWDGYKALRAVVRQTGSKMSIVLITDRRVSDPSTCEI